MINPTDADIGRPVIYFETIFLRTYDKLKPEKKYKDSGIITSFNSEFVFVRYNNDQTSKATKREDLEWGNITKPPSF